MDVMNFIKPELLILVPVLYTIGLGIKKSNVTDKYTSNDGDVYEGDTVKTCTYMVNNIQKAYTANYFDTFKRLSTKETKLNQNNFIKHFTYNGSRISKMEDTVLNMKLGTNNYSYDSMGRIVSNTYSSKNTTSNYRTYMYDQYGQLIRENNEGLDKTFVYEYDSIGNIISVKEYDFTLSNTPSGTCTEKSYTYNTTYPDRLTNYNGSAIYYDSMGYPTSYGSHQFTWDKGKLARVHRGSAQQPGSLYTDCKFTYDAYGRRLSKSYTHDPNPASTSDYSYTYNTTYNYDNSGRLLREYCTEKYISGTTTTREFVYLYDESSMVGVLYSYNGSTPVPYYYHKNLQGDVIAIYDASGYTKAEYTYDAWGNCTVTNSTLYDLAYNNPIRYRSYYYDRETGLYYLNARYYYPEWRKFISTDNVANINPKTPNGINLFAYSNNDPINIQYSSAMLNSRYIGGGKISSINSAISDAVSIEKNFNRKNSLPNIPGWVDTISTGLDHGFSMINPIRSSIACLQFTDLWDLMRLDGVTELPGTLSKVATVVGWGLSIAGGLINTGISIGGMYVSTAVASSIMGVLAASSLSIPGAVIVVGGAVIAIGVGIAINHLASKLTIGGNTIEGHLNDFADWLIFWD